MFTRNEPPPGRYDAMQGGASSPPRAAGRLRTLGRLALVDRPLCGDYLRAYVAGWDLRARAHADSGTEAPASPVLAPSQARAWVLGRAGLAELDGGPALALAHASVNRDRGADGDTEAARIAAGLAGDASLGELAYVIVRVLRPRRVVETGVASGVTTAFVLAALADNDAGRLDSVDLPPLAMRAAGLVGSLIPDSLRDRWTYHWGSSRRLLAPLLAGAELDVFIHDSDHSYDGMRWELEQAWNALRPGGWLIADDVHMHSAFDDVARRVGGVAIRVEQPDKGGSTGVLVKPER